MSKTEKNAADVNDDSTAEEIRAYIQSKPPIFVDHVEYQGMSLSVLHPDLVDEDTKALLETLRKQRQAEALGNGTAPQDLNDAKAT